MTASERFLADLCERSFLSLWSYPNLFRKPAKELTDLLVVFGNDLILFSDKSCAFPDSRDADLDWERWFRRSISNSAAQITQAENWIKRQPDRVYLDVNATQRLPLALPHPDRMRFHRILIALNSGERCQAATGHSPLELSPKTIDNEKPFAVGRISNTNGWVHVFTEATLPVILSELSTVADFLDYLRKKESLYEEGKYVRSQSELDLLAYFLWNGRTFPVVEAEQWETQPHLWGQIDSDPQFLAARKENEVSVFWDRLIEHLNDLYMRQDLESGNDHEISDHERVLRVMAAETRFDRRVASKWILERAELAKKGYVGSLLPSNQQDVLYVLLIGPGDGGKDHARYREARKKELSARCIAGKAAHPERRTILGIALDAKGVKGSSEDFILMDTSDWTAEQIAEAERIRQDGKFFVGNKRHLDEWEYPNNARSGTNHGSTPI
ncbi:hypothetical protein JQ634_22195 [Bradyrhizobium sp. AUGA SZCCT0240]|uniref:hypothetical protein n=1 Tax=Bradyrhizobium sp. AUGA SZCCT0240 TaxID=2807669 RepID=UPI001BAD0636|nr:hypothetical protein [Bradyrhizobium sp. AUGA SZCCT0240]MBR1256404.1 hypothetical protein [Bradyrhizobium sp. AUGA SZCCT0240]